MSGKKLPRNLTEKVLLNNMTSATDRNFISEVNGVEYLCRYLGRSAEKTLGYRVVPREKAMVLLYEYAGKEPFDRAYAMLETRNRNHHKLIHLHTQSQ